MKLDLCDKFFLGVGDCFISYNELLLAQEQYWKANCVNFSGFNAEWTPEDGEMAFIYVKSSIVEVSWRKEEKDERILCVEDKWGSGV